MVVVVDVLCMCVVLTDGEREKSACILPKTGDDMLEYEEYHSSMGIAAPDSEVGSACMKGTPKTIEWMKKKTRSAETCRGGIDYVHLN